MTILDAINSMWDWDTLDWTNKIDTIWRTTMGHNKAENYIVQYTKMILSWVVMSRIVIAHLYTITHMANLYSILTWRRKKLLLPWLMISAFKNFVLETIVIVVVTILYIEGNISGFLFGTVIIDKMIVIGIAAHNWNKINLFYHKLDRQNRQYLAMKKYALSSLLRPHNIMLGMNMQNVSSAECSHHQPQNPSLPPLQYSHTSSSICNFKREIHSSTPAYKSLTFLPSSSNEDDQNDSYSTINNDSNISTADKVIKRLGFTYNDWKDLLILREAKYNRPYNETSENSIFEIKYITSEDDIDDDDQDNSKMSTCVCVSDGSDNNLQNSPTKKESMEIQSLTSNCSQHNLTETDHSAWSNQWALEYMLKDDENEKYVQSDLIENKCRVQISCADACSQWSLDDNLENDEKNKIHNDKCCQWPSHNQLNVQIGERINRAWPSQLDCMEILKSVIDGIFIMMNQKEEIDTMSNSEDKNKKNDVATQTGQTLYRTNSTQTSSNKNLLSLYCTTNNIPLTQKILEDYSGREKVRETSQEREKKEMKALRVYNALTLWRYKEEKEQQCEKEKLYVTKLPKNEFYYQKHQKHGNLKKELMYDSEIDDIHIGRALDCSQASVNIPGFSVLNHPHKQSNVKLSNKKHRKKCIFKIFEKLQSYNDFDYTEEKCRQIILRSVINLKQQILRIDWSNTLFSLNNKKSPNLIRKNKDKKSVCKNSSSSFLPEFPSSVIEAELLNDIIDEYDTIDLLQCAFSFETNENSRGFHLGPASSDLYSISEQIPNVLQQIVKSARIKTLNYDCSNYPSTQEVDYGDDYLQSLKPIIEHNTDQVWAHDTSDNNNNEWCTEYLKTTDSLHCQNQDVNECTKKAINDANKSTLPDDDKRNLCHYFDDDADDDWSDESFSAANIQMHIDKVDSLNSLSNASNMSEFSNSSSSPSINRFF